MGCGLAVRKPRGREEEHLEACAPDRERCIGRPQGSPWSQPWACQRDTHARLRTTSEKRDGSMILPCPITQIKDAEQTLVFN